MAYVSEDIMEAPILVVHNREKTKFAVCLPDGKTTRIFNTAEEARKYIEFLDKERKRDNAI